MFPAYAALAAVVFGMNIVPLFMPPTWLVLAFFYTRYDLLLLPTVLIGACFATSGRVILAQLSQRYFRRLLPKNSQDNYTSLGNYFNQHKNFTIPLVIIYAFFPIPSNHVFIASGLAKVNIKVLATSFFIGRLISYTFWISLTKRFSDHLEDLFTHHYTNIGAIILEIGGLVLLYLIGQIAWKRILKRIS